ncbi:MAG: DNRLRE domain-containing protein [bacterium]
MMLSRSRMTIPIRIFALLFIVSGMNAGAQIVYEFQNGVNGYEGVSDTFFQTADPTEIHGDSIEWEYDGEDGGGINYGVLNFADVFGTGENQIPVGSNVLEAYLTLTVTNNGDGGATVHELLKPFTEEMDAIAFTLNPDMIAGDDYDEEVLATLPAVGTMDVIRVNVTSSLQKWADGSDYNGWMFVPGGNDGVSYQSSEFPPNPVPRLIVVTPLGEFVFQEGVNGYEGAIDTYINTGTEFETVYGDDTSFEWDGDDNGGANYSLVRYDDIFGDGPNQIPLGTEITSAHLRLTITNPGNDAEVHEILEGSEDEPTDFNETDTSMLTWGDLFEPRAGIDYAEEVVSIIPGGVGTVMVDVTTTVQKYSDGEPNRGWIFVPTGTDGAVIVASDYANTRMPPRLIVDTSEGVFEFQEGRNNYTEPWIPG